VSFGDGRTPVTTSAARGTNKNTAAPNNRIAVVARSATHRSRSEWKTFAIKPWLNAKLPSLSAVFYVENRRM
jgi:hypothetical protein